MSLSPLEGLAYRMLGSVADAEDVVQEARLRLLRQDSAPRDESAWLFRVVTNLALDKLRERKRQRLSYPGPWLPEPLPTAEIAADPAAGTGVEPDAAVELAESLSMGLLLVLERLSAAERVVYVLREGFDLPFEDIATLVEASPAACRQRYRRARRHLHVDAGPPATRPGLPAPPAETRALLERLLAAVAERDTERVASLFAEDAVAYADGGGVVSAAIRPVTDPARIARVIVHLAEKADQQGGMEIRWVELNAGPALLIEQGGQLHSSLQMDVAGGLIRRLYVMRNPAKLAHLTGSAGQALTGSAGQALTGHGGQTSA